MLSTRRQWIRGGIAAAAATGFAASSNPCSAIGPADAIAGIQGVHLAVATICADGFGNHHHRPSFKTLPSLGYRNVEFNLWYPDTISPAYIQSIRTRCKETGLVPISLQGSGFGGEGNNGLAKDFAHKLLLMQGCKTLGCHIVKCTGSRRGTQGGIKSVIEVCKELAPVAEEMGVLIVLENHANNVLERPQDYEQIFEQIDSPSIGMCLDTGHFEGVGVDLHKVVDQFHSRILHVDLKDCAARGQGHNTVPFGEGVTDFDSFLAHLFEKDYRGYLVIEQAWREPKGDWEANLKRAQQRFSLAINSMAK